MSKPMVVLVGDIVTNRAQAISTRSFDADKPTKQDIEQIVSWLVQAGYPVDVYDSVTKFASHPPRMKGIVVLPLWRGGASRNRTAIVPAICEDLRIPYIGGDVFVQTVCQDKSLSKVFATNAGFSVPAEWYLPARLDLHNFMPSRRLSPPFVVKPQYSAASIGIDDASLCGTDQEACERARYLFDIGLGPVICEEFVTGDEISLCFLEEQGRIIASCVPTFLDDAGSYPYRTRLMTFDEKADEDDSYCRLCLWPSAVPDDLWLFAAKLVRLLGKVDHMRVDGRINDRRFVVIELTQDSHLGLTSELVGGFNAAGTTPPAFFDMLIQASLRSQASQNTSLTS
jgi:D-alanine-D-alanine ligase